jgi:hypothetical protein
MDYQNVPRGAIRRILGHGNRTTTTTCLHSICERKADYTWKFPRSCVKPILRQVAMLLFPKREKFLLRLNLC